LRILRAVSLAELSVAEIVSILGLPQSTVSRHLKPLRDSGLLETRREATSIYYHQGEAFKDPALARLLEDRLDDVPEATEDKTSVRRVLEQRKQRSRDFFDQIAGRYGTLTEPGGGWQALAAGLAAGFAGKAVADLGAGEGTLTLLLARYGANVTAVDQSTRMLALVEEKAAGAGLDPRVRIAEGDIESLPMEDEAFDAVFLSQVLHHAARPQQVLAETARILKPGGSAIILDLVRHEQEWVREEWADQWLGFEEDELKQWIGSAGLELVNADRHAGSTPELSVLIMVAAK
ncbi:MAG: metalloregulator ArsR/SmtB family transcription factor, partial [Verrucomicrobiota bacterium]